MNVAALWGATVALLHWPAIAHDNPNPRTHCRHRRHPAPGWTCRWPRWQTPMWSVGTAPQSTLPTLHSRWGGFSPTPYARHMVRSVPSQSPAVTSGLVIVPDAPVSMVMIHDLSPNHPLAFKLSLSCFATILNVQRGGGSDRTSAFLAPSSIQFLVPGQCPLRKSF
jgi:hypothetical protein